MVLSNDVELNGVAFNVVPGTYERTRRKPLAVRKPAARNRGRAEKCKHIKEMGTVRAVTRT